MTYWKRIACLTLLGAGAMLAEQWTGWITDAQCANDPAGNFTGDAHKKCIEQGQPIVFVNEADKTIHLITNAGQMKQARTQWARRSRSTAQRRATVRSKSVP